MIRVVTLMWGTAWERYGKVFVETFHKHWPKDVDLIVVADRTLPLPRGEIRYLRLIPGYEDFIARWGGVPSANGRDRPTGSKVDENGCAWRFDAVKWMPQAIAATEAIDDLSDGDVLVWFDADVETFKAVPPGFVDRILGEADLVHLGRAKHSEIGFWAIRVGPLSRLFVQSFADIYRSDAVFDLKEWHSAYAFDACLEKAKTAGLKVKDLSPGDRGHVWPQTPLAAYTAHKKGKRKALGLEQAKWR